MTVKFGHHINSGEGKLLGLKLVPTDQEIRLKSVTFDHAQIIFKSRRRSNNEGNCKNIGIVSERENYILYTLRERRIKNDEHFKYY